MTEAFMSIQLTEVEICNIARYKSFGQKWIDGCIRQAKANKYVEKHCEIVKEKTSYGNPYNCCRTGKQVYKRKDGQLIQDADFEALKAIDLGQENTFIKSDDGMEMTHKWLCDSSD